MFKINTEVNKMFIGSINCFGFVDHRVSVTTTNLCICGKKAATDDRDMKSNVQVCVTI